MVDGQILVGAACLNSDAQLHRFHYSGYSSNCNLVAIPIISI
jgi:hypothetical protein